MQKQLIFTTTEGLEVPYSPISLQELELAEAAIRKEMADAREPLDPPTYTVQVLGGGIETHVHNLTTLDVPDDEEATRLNHKAWDEYLEANTKLQEQIANLRTDLVMDAIKLEMPPLEEWVGRQKRLGIQLPEREPGQSDEDYAWGVKKHWLTTRVFKTGDDLMGIITAVMASSMTGLVPEEQIAAAAATFRGSVSDLFQGDGSRNAATGAEAQQGAVGNIDNLRGGNGDEGVAPDTEPLQGTTS